MVGTIERKLSCSICEWI